MKENLFSNETYSACLMALPQASDGVSALRAFPEILQTGITSWSVGV